MRTNIEIDDQLLKQVMQNGKYPTKKAAIEAALQALGREYTQRATYFESKKDAKDG